MKGYLVLLTVVFATLFVVRGNAQSCAYGDNSGQCAQAMANQNAEFARIAAEQEALSRERSIENSLRRPYYGAIAISDYYTGTAAGYRRQSKAEKNALAECALGSNGNPCKLIATFFNTCAAVAMEKNSKLDRPPLIVSTGDGVEAARRNTTEECEAKNGKGRCLLILDDKAVCTGFKYGVTKGW